MKNSKKKRKFKNPLKKIMIFSNIFLLILHNIGLYIYIVKYKSGIKIPVFLRNVFKKKNSKHFQKEKNIFFAHGQILNFFSSIFFIKKKHCIFFMFF